MPETVFFHEEVWVVGIVTYFVVCVERLVGCWKYCDFVGILNLFEARVGVYNHFNFVMTLYEMVSLEDGNLTYYVTDIIM